jgi:hypothetical protein
MDKDKKKLEKKDNIAKRFWEDTKTSKAVAKKAVQRKTRLSRWLIKYYQFVATITTIMLLVALIGGVTFQTLFGADAFNYVLGLDLVAPEALVVQLMIVLAVSAFVANR